MSSCTSSLVQYEITPEIQTPTSKPITTQGISVTENTTSIALNEARWDIYDPDPQHLWNRLFRQFYRRTSNDGREFGWDALDPLFWHDTIYLLEETSYQQAISVLNEFLSTKGENLITDPLKRAMFQRDMWAVFDWLTLRSDSYPTQSQELQRRLAQVLRKVALTEDEILSLPDNYEAVVRSRTFPTNYQNKTPNTAFLPVDLLRPDSEWVCLGREGGPVAMSHTEEFPFFGRSVFLVFIRVSGGREATLKFLQELNEKRPLTLQLTDTEVALVRQTILISDQGRLTLSPITESVQFRHYAYVGINSTAQYAYEFKLNRVLLFTNAGNSLQPITKEIRLFRSHGDVFQMSLGVGEELLPANCNTCHEQSGSGLTMSFLSFSRFRFPLPEQNSPVLINTTPKFEAQTVIMWKQKHQTWQELKTLWDLGNQPN